MKDLNRYKMQITSGQSQAKNWIYLSWISFYLDIHLHSTSWIWIKRKEKEKKIRQYRQVFKLLFLRTGTVSFLSFLTNNTTHCANQRYDSFLTPPTGTVKLLAGSPASCFARATRQTGKINNSLKFFKLII